MHGIECQEKNNGLIKLVRCKRQRESWEGRGWRQKHVTGLPVGAGPFAPDRAAVQKTKGVRGEVEGHA